MKRSSVVVNVTLIAVSSLTKNRDKRRGPDYSLITSSKAPASRLLTSTC